MAKEDDKTMYDTEVLRTFQGMNMFHINPNDMDDSLDRLVETLKSWK